ncbi:chromate efflux transporter [Methylophaga sp. OBS4]|uniref:chromate efflux transporter n=1 Tax=Methylophaga sp. OBS4 TaxID=2991935 RepID=UPI0022575242|nr:chromate efflux transporter [Methylophaga sp. OBS4]MCX4186966.1 chromate efflux transporter [Methylophaga sp. OBS4]
MKTTGSVFEVFIAFLKLGLTSFGGPIAHIAYYRHAFVEKRRWLTEEQFTQLLVLCQFLPGPASSQMGFTLGLLRAGWLGAIAAFVAFTLPSAILLFIFAQLLPVVSGTISDAAIHGLKLVALSVVAQAVLLMARQLCPDLQRLLIALVSVVLLLLVNQPLIQLLVVVAGAVAGLVVCRDQQLMPVAELKLNYGKHLAWLLLAIFTVLLLGLPLLADSSSLLAVVEAFYQAGALVFGGGHVVLPLLENTVVAPGWVAADEYLAGYGAAQAVPGPLFSVAAYLGAMLPGDNGGLSGALVALLAIFLPGFLLVAAILPLWKNLLNYPAAASAVAGVNAAVVGLLAAALYDPLWVSVVDHISDFIIALTGFLLLQFARLSPLIIVVWCVSASIVVSLV